MATVKKRKEKKSVYEGNVYIQATFNDTYTLGMEKDYKKLIKDLKRNIVVQEYI